MCVGVGVFCFQAEDGIRDLVRSRGLGDVYKRQKEGDALQKKSQVTDEEVKAYFEGNKDAFKTQGKFLSLIHI